MLGAESQATHQELDIGTGIPPITCKLNYGFRPGSFIKISGQINRSAKRFHINLQNTDKYNADVILHINPRFASNDPESVLASFRQKWKRELERGSSLPNRGSIGGSVAGSVAASRAPSVRSSPAKTDPAPPSNVNTTLEVIRPDVERQILVLNTKENGSWGTESKESLSTLVPGKQFEIAIVCEDEDFKISLNNKFWCSYKHRISPWRIKYVGVHGKVKYSAITYNPGAAPVWTMGCRITKMELSDRSGNSCPFQAEILKEVESIPLRHCIPGTMIVYGENATPILTTVKPSEVIIAAATLGLGRIIVCTHTLFGEEIIKPNNHPKLSENLRNWLANEEKVHDSEVMCIDNDVMFPVNKKILVWKGASNKSAQFLSSFKSFILKGGALLCAHTPWGYLQLNPGKTLESMPVYPLFEEIGICFTGALATIPDERCILIKNNRAGNAHFGKCIDKIWDNNDDSLDYCDVVQHCCNTLPECIPSALKTKLDNIVPSHINDIQYILPSAKKPLKDKKGLATLSMAHYALKCTGGNLKAPGIEEFPGDFSSPPHLTSTEINITSDICEHFSTGYYAPAGQIICIKTLTITGSWSVHIGAHRDDLTNHSELRRWPKVCIQKDVKDVMEFTSPMGGLIYFQNTCTPSTLKATIENVTEAPYFNLCDPKNVSDWPRRRNSPGLWADIAGKYITVTVPSSCVRDLECPSGIISKWDEVVCAHHDLRGTDPSKYQREWVVTDEQPSAGYMHSGYPIVTHLDVTQPDKENFILSLDKLVNNGSWGLFHEIGHNMQRSNWTYEGTVEVTCNIFTLHAMDKICNKKPWIHEWLNNQMKGIKDYLNNGANISEWKKKPGVALCIYAQIIHEFGWEPYKKVFRGYEKLEININTNNVKIDEWIIRMSFAVHHDLSPLFKFWGFPISTNVVNTLENLPPFLPDDEVTRFVPSRVSQFVTDRTVRVGPVR